MSIEWCTWSWNPVIGCSPVSPGCAHCYAAITAFGLVKRFKNADYEGLVKPGAEHALWTGQVKCLPERLAEPLHKKQPQVVFVNSMGDLFHPLVPFDFIGAVFGIMAAAPQHEFIILTKHIERAVEFMAWLARDCDGRFVPPSLAHHAACTSGWGVEGEGDYIQRTWNKLPAIRSEQWPLPNVHLGPSIENQAMAEKRLPAAAKLAERGWKVVASCEPLLEGVASELSGYWPAEVIGQPWVIAGGESGDNARRCDITWLRRLRDFCEPKGIPFYCKQLGARPIASGPYNIRQQGIKDHRGADPSEWPEDLRVFQAPPRIAAILNAQKNPPRVVAALEKTPVTVSGSIDWDPPQLGPEDL